MSTHLGRRTGVANRDETGPTLQVEESTVRRAKRGSAGKGVNNDRVLACLAAQPSVPARVTVSGVEPQMLWGRPRVIFSRPAAARRPDTRAARSAKGSQRRAVQKRRENWRRPSPRRKAVWGQRRRERRSLITRRDLVAASGGLDPGAEPDVCKWRSLPTLS